MSKVLKFQEVDMRSPYLLKALKPEMAKRFSKQELDKVRLVHHRVYDDEAKALLEDAVKKARDILEESKAQAEKILDEAEQQKAYIEKQAFEKGYKEGLIQGREISLKENKALWEERLKQFNLLKKQLLEQNKQYLDYLEKEALKVSLHIAEKILNQQIELDSESFASMIKRALEKIGEEKAVTIRISEEDYQSVAGIEDFTSGKNGKTKISFVKDPLLSSGDCIIQGDCFELDAGIHTQTQHIREKLKEIGVLEDA